VLSFECVAVSKVSRHSPEATETQQADLDKRNGGMEIVLERSLTRTGCWRLQAARVESQLQRAGWKAAAVHGDASQAQRTRAVEQFKVSLVASA